MLSLSKYEGRVGRLAQGEALVLSLLILSACRRTKYEGRVGRLAQGEPLMLSLLILSACRRTKYEGRCRVRCRSATKC